MFIVTTKAENFAVIEIYGVRQNPVECFVVLLHPFLHGFHGNFSLLRYTVPSGSASALSALFHSDIVTGHALIDLTRGGIDRKLF